MEPPTVKLHRIWINMFWCMCEFNLKERKKTAETIELDEFFGLRRVACDGFST